VIPSFPSVISTWPNPDGSVKAIASLLVSVEEAPAAVRFLLSLRRWNEAISLVQEVSSSNDIVQQVELFHTLFSTVLEHNQTQRDVLDRLWEVVPRNYSIYDLLALLKAGSGNDGAAPTSDDMLVTDTQTLTIGAVRSQLVKLMQREVRSKHVIF